MRIVGGLVTPARFAGYYENTKTDKMPTACTLLPESLDPFLNAMSILYSWIEHDMHSLLSKGDVLGAIELSLQTKYGVDSTTTRNIWHNLKGKQASVDELRAIEAKDIKGSITSIEKAVKKLEKTVKQKRKGRIDFSKEKFMIHQKKRRLEIKRKKLTRALTNKSLCFGTKKLFNAQHHLDANGYSTHEEWREDWRSARTSNFMMVGSKIYKGGNQLCRLGSDGSLTITVPKCLIPEFGTHVTCPDVFFRYGQGWIDAALESKSWQSSLVYSISLEA